MQEAGEDGESVVEINLRIDRGYAVKSYLHSILYNLISNALKYRASDRESEISLSADTVGEEVLLQVADNGIGIDLEQHGANLFKMYHRFTDLREGRGLGLYLVKVQTESMGGHIEVQSQVGKGTTFSVWLPRKEKKG